MVQALTSSQKLLKMCYSRHSSSKRWSVSYLAFSCAFRNLATITKTLLRAFFNIIKMYSFIGELKTPRHRCDDDKYLNHKSQIKQSGSRHKTNTTVININSVTKTDATIQFCVIFHPNRSSTAGNRSVPQSYGIRVCRNFSDASWQRRRMNLACEQIFG